MSINSWKQEFYQGRLRDAARDPVKATEHCIVKQNDPEPMIKVLKQVRKQLKEEQRVQSSQP